MDTSFMMNKTQKNVRRLIHYKTVEECHILVNGYNKLLILCLQSYISVL